jgi:hypothetical protein
MAQIELKKDWFGPDGVLREVRNNPHTVPDSWKVPDAPKETTADKDAEPTGVILPAGTRILGKSDVVDVERLTADGSVVIETQVIGEGAKLGDLDGKAGDAKDPSTVQLPDASVKTPTPATTPEKK